MYVCTQVHVYVCKCAFAYVRPSIPPSVCVSVHLYVCPPSPACCGTSWGGAWVTKLVLSHCLAGRGHGPWHPPQLWRVSSCSKLKLKSTVIGSSSLVWCDIYTEDTQRPCMAQKVCLSQPSAWAQSFFSWRSSVTLQLGRKAARFANESSIRRPRPSPRPGRRLGPPEVWNLHCHFGPHIVQGPAVHTSPQPLFPQAFPRQAKHRLWQAFRKPVQGNSPCTSCNISRQHHLAQAFPSQKHPSKATL